MKAIIKLDVPEWQIGQIVSVHFPDTMCKNSVCLAEESSEEPGYWIQHPDYNGNPYALEYECSACTHRVSRITNHCPSCGKELKGVKKYDI